jgi:hypothetical protein
MFHVFVTCSILWIFVYNNLYSHPSLIKIMCKIGYSYKVSLFDTDFNFHLHHRRRDWPDGFRQLIYISQLSFHLNEKCEIFRRNKSVVNLCELTSGCLRYLCKFCHYQWPEIWLVISRRDQNCARDSRISRRYFWRLFFLGMGLDVTLRPWSSERQSLGWFDVLKNKYHTERSHIAEDGV